jgi:hypothetical protein
MRFSIRKNSRVKSYYMPWRSGTNKAFENAQLCVLSKKICRRGHRPFTRAPTDVARERG